VKYVPVGEILIVKSSLWSDMQFRGLAVIWYSIRGLHCVP